jgi:hypothetical protein
VHRDVAPSQNYSSKSILYLNVINAPTERGRQRRAAGKPHPASAFVYGDHWQVLAASVHNVRYFAALLHGVNFVNVRNKLDMMHRHTITPVLACNVDDHEERVHRHRRGSENLARSDLVLIRRLEIEILDPSNRIHLQGCIR